jgi:hypothetical protein
MAARSCGRSERFLSTPSNFHATQTRLLTPRWRTFGIAIFRGCPPIWILEEIRSGVNSVVHSMLRSGRSLFDIVKITQKRTSKGVN